MTVRTNRETVTFTHPFRLAALDGVHPPGTYVVETEEELVEGLSFLAYRRTASVIMMPGPAGGSILVQVVPVDPVELDAAQRSAPGTPSKV